MLAERLQSLEVDSKGSPGSKKAISASRSATAATAKGMRFEHLIRLAYDMDIFRLHGRRR